MKKIKARYFKPSLFRFEDRFNPSAFAEPIVLNSVNGLLDITLLAHQSNQMLETTGQTPFNAGSTPAAVLTGGLYTYQWTLNSGQASLASVNVSTTQGDNYTGPTLNVNRGDTIRIRMENDLPDSIPLAPNTNTADNSVSQMMPGPQPINNHMHGFHVSPEGSSDNVLIEIPQEMGFVYEYTIPQDQPDGLFWLHNHRHEFTNDQTYRGLASMIIVGNAASNIDQIASILPVNQRVMAMQTQNLASATNPSIPSYLVNPQMDGAAYSVGGASGTPLQYLQYFQGGNVDNTAPYTDPTSSPGGIPNSFIKQYTINGLVNPTITVGTGQTEVWSFDNISSGTNFQIGLYTGSTLVPNNLFQISQDGNVLSNAIAGNGLIIAPGSRYSFVITAPSTANTSYTLKANDIASGNKQGSYPISLVTFTTNNTNGTTLSPVISTGTALTSPSNNAFVDLSTAPIAANRTVVFSSQVANPNAGNSISGGGGNAFQINGESFPENVIFQPRLGTVEEWTILNYSNQPHPFHIHVNDFQVMSIFAPTEPLGSVQFYPGNVTSPYQYGLDVINIPPALFANSVITNLTVTAGGSGFTNGQIVNISQPSFGASSASTINATGSATVNSAGQLTAVTILSSGAGFNSTFNSSGIQKAGYVTITAGTASATGTVVVQNGVVVPGSPPSQGAIVNGQASNTFGNVLVPGKIVIRYNPVGFTGSYVYHCHILTHEDRGMMAQITILPNIPIYATGAGAGGTPQVNVYSSLDNSLISSFLAFEPSFSGGVSTAVADVNNDGISDLICGAGPGGGPRVIVFNGATNFTTVLQDFFAFDQSFRGGVDVAGADFNVDGFADIVVSAGPGGGPEVRVFDANTLNVLTQFYAYDTSFSGGVTVATGETDGSGLSSLITGAGPGGGSHVKIWRNALMYTIGSTPILPGAQTISTFTLTGQFMAYESAYTGGVNVSTGLVGGMSQGGFDRIITGTINGAPLVSVWQAMDHMDPFPMSATPKSDYTMQSSFFAFNSNDTNGVFVGAVDGSTGSDLIVTQGKGSNVLQRYSFLPGTANPIFADEFSPFPIGFLGGISLGGTN
jgi:FtsP/CotA-like multicopper oxidase with cupredoxin domain